MSELRQREDADETDRRSTAARALVAIAIITVRAVKRSNCARPTPRVIAALPAAACNKEYRVRRWLIRKNLLILLEIILLDSPSSPILVIFDGQPTSNTRTY